MRGALVVAMLGASLVAGCGKGDDASSSGGTPPGTMQATLAVEIRDTADVTIVPRGSDATAVTLAFSAGYGLFDPAAPLSAPGRIEAFPEAGMTLYTARFSAPAVASGPCGAQPVSLALALTRRGRNARVGGGLTAYCGADTWSGVPARIVRIAGDLPN